MSWCRPITAISMQLARDCLSRGGSLIDAATLIGCGRDELDFALWLSLGERG